MATLLQNRGDVASLIIPAALAQSNAEITLSLEWKKPSGWLSRALGSPCVDLDLGCYYELKNGERKLIDWLQFSEGNGGPRNRCTRQGCYTAAPYIWHSGDDQDTGLPGEKIYINPAGLESIERLLIYAYIYDGPALWEKIIPTLHISVPGCEPINLSISNTQSDLRFCALADVQVQGNAMNISRLGTFHDGHSGCDEVYGWGFAYHK